jgi:hypothetical protein
MGAGVASLETSWSAGCAKVSVPAGTEVMIAFKFYAFSQGKDTIRVVPVTWGRTLKKKRLKMQCAKTRPHRGIHYGQWKAGDLLLHGSLRKMTCTS